MQSQVDLLLLSSGNYIINIIKKGYKTMYINYKTSAGAEAYVIRYIYWILYSRPTDPYEIADRQIELFRLKKNP